MTKTEKNKLILKQLLLNLKEKFDITTDFYDGEGSQQCLPSTSLHPIPTT